MQTLNIKLKVTSIAILLLAVVIIARISYLSTTHFFKTQTSQSNSSIHMRHRILDRNGNILAISIPAYEYHINPSFIINTNYVVEKITKLFPELDKNVLKEKLSGKFNGWFLIKKEITPQQKQQIMLSGIEGSFFKEYYTRLYPHNSLFSHIIGYTNYTNGKTEGIKGIERSQNKRLQFEDVALSVDVTLQNVLHEELTKTFKKFQPNGAFATLIDLKTRQILASVSLPDFNPMQNINPKSKNNRNIPLSSTFNLGSVFKIFTIALALESNFTNQTSINLPQSIPVTKTFSITDEHRKQDVMTLEEILAYSSNVGVSFLTQKIGFEKQRDFFQKLGIFEKPTVEFASGEISRPIFVKEKWREAMHYTASYGYGISISPLHFLETASGIVYDGKIIPLTILLENQNHEKYPQIISQNNIEQIQQMLKSVVKIGTARRATINGYSICGKTGTALKFNKNIKKWDGNKKFLSFFSTFPCNNPQYALYIGIDEPTAGGNIKYLQASNTTVKTTANIIKIIAPILNTKPDKNGKN